MMKKFLFVCSLLASIIAVAQRDTIANGGMENWHNPYMEPNNWFTLNSLIDYGYPASTTQTTDTHSGQFAARLESMSSSFSNIPGIVASGPILNAGGNPDFSKISIPFKSRPISWRFYYKTMPASSDTCAASMVLTLWDSAHQQTDTVAMARFQQSATINSYTLADIPFNYLSSKVPDSASIIFTSSINGFSPVVGSVFYIDDISLIYDHTAVDNTLKSGNMINIYPNPFALDCSLHFDAQESGILFISITDLQGRLVLEKSINILKGNNTIKIKEISMLPKGLFLLRTTMNHCVQVIKLLKDTD